MANLSCNTHKLHRPILIGPRRIEVLEFRAPSAATLRAAQARGVPPGDDFDTMLLALSLTSGIDEATLDRQLSARDFARLSQDDFSAEIAALVKGN